MSDDPHPCKVTRHYTFKVNYLLLTAVAAQLQEQNVPPITSDEDKHSSILIMGAENIADFTLNQNKSIFSDDLGPYPLAQINKAQRLRTASGAARLQINRFSLN